MAPAYRVDGAAASYFDGTYYRMATAQCNGKPVYQQGGSDGGYMLFQPEGQSDWVIGPSDRATSCDSSGFIESNGNGGSCAASPDGGGCSGRRRPQWLLRLAWGRGLRRLVLLRPAGAGSGGGCCSGRPA